MEFLPPVDQVADGKEAVPRGLEVDCAKRVAKCLEASVHVAHDPVPTTCGGVGPDDASHAPLGGLAHPDPCRVPMVAPTTMPTISASSVMCPIAMGSVLRVRGHRLKLDGAQQIHPPGARECSTPGVEHLSREIEQRFRDQSCEPLKGRFATVEHSRCERGVGRAVRIVSTSTPAPTPCARCLKEDSGRTQAPVDELGTDPEVPADDLR